MKSENANWIEKLNDIIEEINMKKAENNQPSMKSNEQANNN